jgi:hypothetical protein
MALTFIGSAVGFATVGGSAAQVGLGLEEPGVATDEGELHVALPLSNSGTGLASDVRVHRISLWAHDLLTPALPYSAGDLEAAEEVVLQLSFERSRSWPRKEFHLVVWGSHRVEGRLGSRRRPFRLSRRIAAPQPDEGEGTALEAVVEARTVDGSHFPPTSTEPPIAEEPEAPPLPTGGVVPVPQPDNPSVNVSGLPRRPLRVIAQADDIVFARGTDEVLSSTDHKGGSPWDPSGASVDLQKGERMVFLTGNLYALLSTDGGATFTHIDPTTIFGNIPLDGMPKDEGLCCDMNLLYIPSIDRFVWTLLTKGSWTGLVDKKGNPIYGFNRLRVATASPAQVLASGGTSWTYWDMTTALFGFGQLAFLDYPDVSFTDSFLHISVVRPDMGGFFVVRVPLADVQFGGTINIGFTNPIHGKSAAGARLAHDSPDAAYWFGHAMTWKVRAFEWLDGSSGYSWRTLAINPWISYDDYTSTTPDGTNWLKANTTAIRGATFQGETNVGGGVARTILVGWNGARGAGFPQPHVRLLPVVKAELGGLTFWTTGAESQIWHPDFAFHHAHLATNANGEVGVSVGAGGGGTDATPVAGFIGDSTLYAIGVSNASLDRYGDYTAIRPHWPNTKLFSVSDYFLQQSPLSGFQRKHQYRLFGRSGDVGSTQ